MNFTFLRSLSYRIACLCLLTVFNQCNSSSEKKETVAPPAKTDKEAKYKIIERQSEGCADREETTCATVLLKYPDFSVSAVPGSENMEEEIQKYITWAFMEEEKFNTANEVAQGFLQAYSIVLEQNPGYENPWVLERTAEVYLQSDSLIGVRFKEYINMGGAHPASKLKYLNFSPDSGELLKIEQLFSAEEVKEWKRRAEISFRKQQKLAPDEPFNPDQYWFPEGEFYLPDNFQLTSDSIFFYFNPYEVSSHARGLIQLGLER